jgi:hypothetical protein
MKPVTSKILITLIALLAIVVATCVVALGAGTSPTRNRSLLKKKEEIPTTAELQNRSVSFQFKVFDLFCMPKRPVYEQGMFSNIKYTVHSMHFMQEWHLYISGVLSLKGHRVQSMQIILSNRQLSWSCLHG